MQQLLGIDELGIDKGKTHLALSSLPPSYIFRRWGPSLTKLTVSNPGH